MRQTSKPSRKKAALTLYRFLVGDPNALHMVFGVNATSREEAVRLANHALTENLSHEGNGLSLAAPLVQSYAVIGKAMRVDASTIVAEEPAWHHLPEWVFNYLSERGYEYSSGSNKSQLAYDEELTFTKALHEGDRIHGSMYGLMSVKAHFDLNVEGWTFHIRTLLYPTAWGRLLDGDGGLHYKVSLHAGQMATTSKELPIILPLYERKFEHLIYALRQTDPVDGLPVPEAIAEFEKDALKVAERAFKLWERAQATGDWAPLRAMMTEKCRADYPEGRHSQHLNDDLPPEHYIHHRYYNRSEANSATIVFEFLSRSFVLNECATDGALDYDSEVVLSIEVENGKVSHLCCIYPSS